MKTESDTPKKVVLFARVANAEQEGEYSIDAQLKTCRAYAASHGFEVVREFKALCEAGNGTPPTFQQVKVLLATNRDCRAVVVEKADRLSRSLVTFQALEELGVEIHLVKEGQVLGKDSKPHDKLIRGMYALLTQAYLDNLREEIRKGLEKKTAQSGVR